MNEPTSPYDRLAPRDRQLLFGGALSRQDRLELERRAETEPELARALVLIAPLDARFHRRVLRSVRTAEGRRRVPWAASWGAGLIVVAAGLVLAVGSPEAPPPSYRIEAQAGWRVDRADHVGRPRRLVEGAPVIVIARPAELVDAQLELGVYVPTAEGWSELGGLAERSASGVIRLRSRWPRSAVEARLTVVVGPERWSGVPPWLARGTEPPEGTQVFVVGVGPMAGSSPDGEREARPAP